MKFTKNIPQDTNIIPQIKLKFHRPKNILQNNNKPYSTNSFLTEDFSGLKELYIQTMKMYKK